MGSSNTKLSMEIENDDMMCDTSYIYDNDEIDHCLLIDGYLRNIGDNMIKKIIPNIINHLIKIFYPNFIVYGIGSNQNGHLGDDHVGISKYHLKKFTKLNTFSKKVTNIDGIYSGWKRIIIKDIFGQLYGAGINNGGQLGFFIDTFDGNQYNESIEQIRNFKKIPISDKINNKNNSYFVELIVRRTFLVCNNLANDEQNIYVCGANFKGECVSKTIYNESTWRPINNFIGFNDKIIEIKGGYYHTLFLTQSGKVYSCGDNEKGQCGINIKHTNNMNDNIIFDPQMVIFNDKTNQVQIRRIYCGTYYNFCIDDKSKIVWIFGSNKHGQMGIDYLNQENIDKPTKHHILSGMEIKKFSMGFGFTACLDNKGICYLFGVNDCGQISNGQCNDGVYNPYIFQNDHTFENIRIEQMECGGFHTVLLTKDTNDIITFGSNLSNQCSSLREKELITSGHIISKSNEIGIGENEYIEKIIAQSRSTLVVINKHKTFK